MPRSARAAYVCKLQCDAKVTMYADARTSHWASCGLFPPAHAGPLGPVKTARDGRVGRPASVHGRVKWRSRPFNGDTSTERGIPVAPICLFRSSGNERRKEKHQRGGDFDTRVLKVKQMFSFEVYCAALLLLR